MMLHMKRQESSWKALEHMQQYSQVTISLQTGCICITKYHANKIGQICSKMERIKYYNIIRDKAAMYSIILNDKTQNYHLLFYNLLCDAEQQKIYSDNGLIKKIIIFYLVCYQIINK